MTQQYETISLGSSFYQIENNIIISKQKYDSLIGLIEKGSIIIFSYTSLDKFNDFYGMIAIHNPTNQNEEEVKSFLKKLNSFSERLERRRKQKKEHLIRTIYFFDGNIKHNSYINMFNYLFHYYDGLTKGMTKKVSAYAYDSEKYDYFKITLDTIIRNFSFTGIKGLEEELLFSIEPNIEILKS